MAKIATSLLVSAVLLSTMTSASFVNQALKGDMKLHGSSEFSLEQGQVNYFDEKHIKFYFAQLRGALDGFQQGLFSNSS